MEAGDRDVDLDVMQSFESGPDCSGFSLATHAKYVPAPGMAIEPEICKVYSLDFAVFLRRLPPVCVQKVSFGWRIYLIKLTLWLFMF